MVYGGLVNVETSGENKGCKPLVAIILGVTRVETEGAEVSAQAKLLMFLAWLPAGPAA